MSLSRAPSIATLRAKLGGHQAKLLVFEDVLGSFGGWELGGKRDQELIDFHEDAQRLLSNWCCTADVRFKRLAGVIPYVLPPLEGQSVWKGHAHLSWAASALAQVFETAKESKRAAEVRPS